MLTGFEGVPGGENGTSSLDPAANKPESSAFCVASDGHALPIKWLGKERVSPWGERSRQKEQHVQRS